MQTLVRKSQDRYRLLSNRDLASFLAQLAIMHSTLKIVQIRVMIWTLRIILSSSYRGPSDAKELAQLLIISAAAAADRDMILIY